MLDTILMDSGFAEERAAKMGINDLLKYVYERQTKVID
jgi:hypothetical protein